MAEQKEPIFFRENCPPSNPPHQHHQHNHRGNQEQSVGGIPKPVFHRCSLPLVHHKTRSAPSFICSAWAVDLSKRDWKSAPPCSQAMLMACFLSLATTMNFDGLSSLWLRKVTTYVLATAGAKIARKRGQCKRGSLGFVLCAPTDNLSHAFSPPAF